MQFANDAEWIGREADRVWHSIASDKAAKVPKSQVREIELAIQSTRQLGRDTRQKQIVRYRPVLRTISAALTGTLCVAVYPASCSNGES